MILCPIFPAVPSTEPGLFRRWLLGDRIPVAVSPVVLDVRVTMLTAVDPVADLLPSSLINVSPAGLGLEFIRLENTKDFGRGTKYTLPCPFAGGYLD